MTRLSATQGAGSSSWMLAAGGATTRHRPLEGAIQRIPVYGWQRPDELYHHAYVISTIMSLSPRQIPRRIIEQFRHDQRARLLSRSSGERRAAKPHGGWRCGPSRMRMNPAEF